MSIVHEHLENTSQKNEIIFGGRKAVLGTKHGKESVIVPILEEGLDLSIETPTDFDTDVHGTFTGEVRRIESQKATVIQKAKDALLRYGASIGIASEGAFFPDPSCPIAMLNRELVAMVDAESGISIVGEYTTNELHYQQIALDKLELLEESLDRLDFPNHGVIIRKYAKSSWFLRKELESLEAMKQYAKFLMKLPGKGLLLETDLRAHKNPTRMRAIGKATEDLMRRIRSKCPDCGTYGFSENGIAEWLKCEWCKAITQEPSHIKFSCQKCQYEEKRAINHELYTDPGNCEFCNP